MKTKYGLPLANADNIFDIASSLGIDKWKMFENPISISDYLKRELGPEEKRSLKYLPKVEVSTFINPKGKIFRGFRSVGCDGSIVFTLLPGNLVVICVEFMHGCEEWLRRRHCTNHYLKRCKLRGSS